MLKRSLILASKALLAALVLVLVWLAYLDAVISSTFDRKRYALPATVYARSLELFEGAQVLSAQLVAELEGIGYRRVDQLFRPGQFRLAGTKLELFTRDFKFPDQLVEGARHAIELRQDRVVALTRDAKTIDLLRLEPMVIGGVYPKHGEDRILVQLSEVPRTLTEGLLAIEDQQFQTHKGFSLTGILRAFTTNLQSGRVVAGGSTITQQLVKNYYLTPDRTLIRKVRELFMSVLLEWHAEKDEILEGYLNEIYLGQEGPRAIHGFALGALHYFDTPLTQLGLHQQALLVGMVKGPSLYNPRRNPDRARERRNLVLGVWAEQGVISQEQAAIARLMPLDLQRQNITKQRFPAYLDLVRRQLRLEYRDEDLSTLGLRIFTAFDPSLQEALQESTQRGLALMGAGDDALESASVVTRVDSGEVVALTGGRRVSQAGFNRALDARRPAGSLFKPAVYLLALEQSERFSLASVLADAPLSHTLANGDVWAPENFDKTYRGEVLLYQALIQSLNLPAVKLGLELGADRVKQTLQRLGISSYIPEVAALPLGVGEYAPIDLAAMYQTIAAGGFRTPLRTIRAIVDSQGQPLRRYPLSYERTVERASMHLLHYALLGVMVEGTGARLQSLLPDDLVTAAKSGTSDDGRDSWFAGFSGDLLTVTWVGFDDNRSTNLTGTLGAGQIWARFMGSQAQRSFSYRMPESISLTWIDERSGLRTGKGCENARRIPFKVGSEPTARTDCRSSSRPVRDWLDKLLGG